MSYSYVRAYRKRSALSQRELGDLMGNLSKDAVRLLEQGRQRPNLEHALALEIVFGVPARTMFPDLFERIEEGVMVRAKRLYEALEAKSDETSARKREALEAIPRGGIANQAV